MPPTLLVSVDTEEEFDWDAPVSPRNRSVTHTVHLHRFQEVFESVGARPTYLVDHPIATTDQSLDVLRGFQHRNACEIGAHLHPWVNPPIEEEICPRNTYLCNLPHDLQRAKVEELTRAIRSGFGVSPTSFKAGRYGFDFGLAPTLQRLGYRVDSSVLAFYSFRDDDGPDFSSCGPEPFVIPTPLPPTAHPDALLEIPCTVGFNRGGFRRWAVLHARLARKPFRLLRPVGILWRLGLLRKIVLSPEGFALPDLIDLMRVVARDPDAILNVTLHSPSAAPGHTPYVRTEAELTNFLQTLRGALTFAVKELGARCLTLSEYETQFRKDRAA